MPLGTGAALAAKLQGNGNIAVAFFETERANQGIFHESLNLASVWKLPIVFICENNQYALNTAFGSTTAVAQIALRAGSYGFPDGRSTATTRRGSDGRVGGDRTRAVGRGAKLDRSDDVALGAAQYARQSARATQR